MPTGAGVAAGALARLEAVAAARQLLATGTRSAAAALGKSLGSAAGSGSKLGKLVQETLGQVDDIIGSRLASGDPGIGGRVGGGVNSTGAIEASESAAVLWSARSPVALDTSAYYSLFDTPLRKADNWNEVVTGLLSGRDLRVPESMIRELTVKSGLNRAEVLQNLTSIAGRVEVLPEGAFANSAALREAGLAGRGMVWDRRIGASAVDLRQMFGTGDWDQARAAVDVLEKALGSRDLARQHVLWLRPKGVPGLKRKRSPPPRNTVRDGAWCRSWGGRGSCAGTRNSRKLVSGGQHYGWRERRPTRSGTPESPSAFGGPRAMVGG